MPDYHGQLAAIKQVDIKLVWYPVWTPDRLSEQAKKQLGIKEEPAPAAKEINLHQPIKTFADQYPEFTEDMAEIGFNRIKIPGMLDTVGRLMTLPMGCRAMGFDLEEVKEKLRLKGYEVTE